jgi:hypothetical protein
MNANGACRKYTTSNAENHRQVYFTQEKTYDSTENHRRLICVETGLPWSTVNAVSPPWISRTQPKFHVIPGPQFLAKKISRLPRTFQVVWAPWIKLKYTSHSSIRSNQFDEFYNSVSVRWMPKVLITKYRRQVSLHTLHGRTLNTHLQLSVYQCYHLRQISVKRRQMKSIVQLQVDKLLVKRLKQLPICRRILQRNFHPFLTDT